MSRQCPPYERPWCPEARLDVADLAALNPEALAVYENTGLIKAMEAVLLVTGLDRTHDEIAGILAKS